MMFTERKDRFLKEARAFWSDATIFTNKNILLLAAPAEEVYGKDLCDFTREEIAEMYSMRTYDNTTSFAVHNSVYKIYTDWCIQNGLSANGQNGFAEYKAESFRNFSANKAKNSKIFTREDMLKFCQQARNARDAYLLISLFEFGRGKSRNEILELKLKDVDQEKHIARLPGGRVVSVSDDWIRIAKRSYSATEYYLNGDRSYELLNEGNIYKFYERETGLSGQLNRYFMISLKRLKAETDIPADVSTKSVEESGILDFVGRHAGNTSKRDWIAYHKEEILKQYSSVNFYSFLRDYKELL